MRDLVQYRSAIENSNIVSKTDINGIITFVNDEFCKICGYSKKELIGKDHNIVRHPDVPKEVFEELWATILKKETFKTTAKNRAKDGSTFYVNTTISPILDKAGNIKEFIAIRYDVTKNILLTQELQKKEEELKELNSNLESIVEEKTKELVELNRTLEMRVVEEVDKNREKDRLMFSQARLAALGEMMGNIAHQWRQPLFELNIVNYNIKKLFLNKDEKGLESEYAHANELVQRMSNTIEDFTNFFNPQKQKEMFSVNDVIKESMAIIKGSLRKEDVSVEFAFDKDFFIYGYKNEFSHALLNILNNAKDTLREKKDKKEIKVMILEDNVNIFVRITDNGNGIDENIIDKIFEPYFTTKHAKAGTGIGLYMVKMIIENSMQGKVYASNTNKGACFEIVLPKKE